MLRCLRPPVRAVGGRGSVMFNLRASRLMSKLTTERATWSLANNSPHQKDSDDVSNDKKLSTTTGDRHGHSEQGASDGCNILPYAITQPGTHRSRTTDVTDMPTAESGTCEPTTLTNTHAITVLKAFLSADNLASPTPTVHTANTIQSMYRSARARNQTAALEARGHSALISLFGSLSLSSPGQPYCSIYAHPFTSAVLETAPVDRHRPYWAMVIWLVRERMSLHGTLAPSDHYYAMRAHLAKLMVSGDGDGAGEDAGGSSRSNSSLRNARHHYRSLAKSTSHPAAHLPYFNAILQMPELTNELVDATRNLISRQPYTNHELLAHLWQLASLPPSYSTAATKSDLLHALSSRVQRTIAIVANSSLPDSIDASHDTQPLTVDDLLKSLTRAISCDIRPHSLTQMRHSYLLRWSLEVVLSELLLDENAQFPETAWSQLRYIAASHTSHQKELEDLVETDPGGSWSWKAVGVLARLEKLLDANNSEDYYYGRQSGVKPESLHSIIKTLWNKWSAGYASESLIFRPVSPAIIAAFLQLARRVQDVEFAESAWSFLKHNRMLSNRAVAVEYCVAAIIGGVDVRQVLPAVLDHVLPASRSAVVTGVVNDLVGVDLALARMVLVVAEEIQLTVEPDALVSLALELSHVGRLDEALTFVSDQRLVASVKFDILAAVLQHTFRAPPTFPVRRLFSTISERVAALVRSHRPPAAAEETLEETFLAALTIYRLPRLSSILRTIHVFWPRFFSHHFLLAAAEELIRQRQFHTASILLRHTSLDDNARRKIVLGLVRGGASHLASMFLRHHAPSSTGDRLFPLDTLVRATRLRQNKTSRLSTLKLPQLMIKSLHPAEAAYAMKLLASAGRAPTHKLLVETHGQLPPKLDPTVVGNMVIGTSTTNDSRRRRARQLKKTVQAMNRLAHEQGFLPDRVTVNILLKAILRWHKAVDAHAVRALFDRMVRSGYPLDGTFPPGVVPFRTDVASGEHFEVPEMTSPISYSAHAVPLYKMFIKALYARRDVEGARIVVGILKRLEAKERLRRGQRALVAFRRKRS